MLAKSSPRENGISGQQRAHKKAKPETTHLVELCGVVDANFERDARVLSLLPGGTLYHVVLAFCQAPRHRRSNVADERLIIHTDDLDIETARVLGGPESTGMARTRSCASALRLILTGGEVHWIIHQESKGGAHMIC